MGAIGKIYQADEKKFDAVISVILGLVIWQVVDSVMIKNPLVLVGPSRVVQAFVSLLSKGVLARHIYTTFVEFILGYLVGVFIGIGVGIVMALSRRAREILNPWVTIWYNAPIVL